MAQTIKIKNSNQALKVPVPGDLAWGEIALNYADGKIYYKKSDGTVQSISGGGGGVWTKITTATTATPFKQYLVDTTSAAFTVTLPAAPAAGDYVYFMDAGDWTTNNLTVARNGKTIEGTADDLVFNVKGILVQMVYDGATWQVASNIGPQGASYALNGALGTPVSATLTNATGLPLTTGTTGILPVAKGGTGTATPALVAGTNVTVSGTWPNQTINASSSIDLASPGPIGGTTPAAGTFTTLIGGADAANYGQLTGGAATKAVQFRTLGTDTNISMALQPKGTGAIDLAAGSSGVNISNGGTVTALTVTGYGGGTYTSIPTNIISVPTTAGGVQATATTKVFAWSTAISVGGTGYTVGDVLTLQGGTFTAQAQVTVATVSSGVITSITNVPANGSYSVAPTNPATTTGGTGTGATVNITALGVGSLTITTAGSGYVEQPTVTFSGGGGSGAAAYATVGSVPKITALAGTGEVWTASGRQLIIGQATSTPTSVWTLYNDSFARSLLMGSGVTGISSGGTSSLSFFTNSTAQQQFAVAHTASAVNYVQVTGGATGAAPTISAQGSDTNAGLNINSKGSGVLIFNRNRDAVNSSSYLFTNVGGLTADASGGSFWRGFHISPINFTIGGANKFPRLAQYFEFDSITDPTYKNVYTSIGNSSDTIEHNFSNETGGGWTFRNSTAFGSDKSFIIAPPLTTDRNYLQVAGASSASSPKLSALGLDTNVSLVVQSKGTGAIDLAAGSSGVNISNGGTVTAITRTNSGAGYTSFPTVSISAPTVAGGVQATATVAYMAAAAATINLGGTGYTLNDVVTLVGGTVLTAAATFTVSAVTGGVVTAVTAGNFQNYTTLPTNPVSVTGGTGTGLTLNVKYVIGAGAVITITNAGSGYVEQPTVTFSGGGGSGAAAYATVGGTPIIRSLGTNLSFYTPAGEQLRLTDNGVSSPGFLQLFGSASGLGFYAGGPTAVSMAFVSKGATGITFATNSTSATQQFAVSHTASAVNYVQVTGSSTGNNPVISVQGSDSTRSLQIASKGTTFVYLQNNGNVSHFSAGGTSSAVNFLNARGNAAGTGPALEATGTDTNIDLALTPKGTGAVLINSILGLNAVTASTTATTAAQVLATFDATLYRTVKFVIQANSNATNYSSTEILAIHNGTTASYTEYATVTIGTACAVYSVDYSSATIRLLATPASATATAYKIAAQLTRI